MVSYSVTMKTRVAVCYCDQQSSTCMTVVCSWFGLGVENVVLHLPA
jgi:hypothetical protein